MGGFVGLNYTAVEFVLRLLGLKNRREVFEGIQTMEFEILRAHAEKRN